LNILIGGVHASVGSRRQLLYKGAHEPRFINCSKPNT
jgi:hypothetical protein